MEWSVSCLFVGLQKIMRITVFSFWALFQARLKAPVFFLGWFLALLCCHKSECTRCVHEVSPHIVQNHKTKMQTNFATALRLKGNWSLVAPAAQLTVTAALGLGELQTALLFLLSFFLLSHSSECPQLGHAFLQIHCDGSSHTNPMLPMVVSHAWLHANLCQQWKAWLIKCSAR